MPLVIEDSNSGLEPSVANLSNAIPKGKKAISIPNIVKLITTNYPNVHYPEGVLEYDDYIEIDMHLTGQGNAKMANFTYEKFIK